MCFNRILLAFGGGLLLAACTVESNHQMAFQDGAGQQYSTRAPVFQIFLGDGENLVLLNDLRYRLPGGGAEITVPAGFVTDLASVPTGADIIVPKMGPHTVAAILHDYLYWDQRCGRDKADRLFRLAMDEYGFSGAAVAELAVQWGGSTSWQQNREERKQGYMKILKPAQVAEIPLNARWSNYRQYLFDQGHREQTPSGIPAYCEKIPG